MANKKTNEKEEAVKKTNTAKTVKKNSTAKANNTTKKKETSSKTPSKNTTKSKPKKEKEIIKEEKQEEVIKKTTSKKENQVETAPIKNDSKEITLDEIDDGFSSNVNSGNRGLILAIVVILVLMVIIICVVGTKGNYNNPYIAPGTNTTGSVQDESDNIKDEEKSDLTTIGIDEYLSLKDSSEEASVIYVGRPTCSHCVIQKPIMEHLVYKYNIKINYLNTDDLSDSDITKLRDSDEYFQSGWGTPLTLIVKGGKIEDKIEGEASISTLTSLLKQYNIISE